LKRKSRNVEEKVAKLKRKGPNVEQKSCEVEKKSVEIEKNREFEQKVVKLNKTS
jgi:uncharacterized protein YfcZ (UPF0381/DUF406 family)